MPTRFTVLLAASSLALGSAWAAGAAAAPARSGHGHVVLEGNGLGLVSLGAGATSAMRAITAALGPPTGHPPVGCRGPYRQVAWHDLVVQFRNGQFSGYRYVAGGLAGLSPSPETMRDAVVPRLTTAEGTTLGSTLAEVERAYPSVHRSGTDFWRTPSGTVFAFYSTAPNPSPSSPVYEIKDDACPAAL